MLILSTLLEITITNIVYTQNYEDFTFGEMSLSYITMLQLYKLSDTLRVYNKNINGNGDKDIHGSIINANKDWKARYLTTGALLSRLHFIYGIL